MSFDHNKLMGVKMLINLQFFILLYYLKYILGINTFQRIDVFKFRLFYGIFYNYLFFKITSRVYFSPFCLFSLLPHPTI